MLGRTVNLFVLTIIIVSLLASTANAAEVIQRKPADQTSSPSADASQATAFERLFITVNEWGVPLIVIGVLITIVMVVLKWWGGVKERDNVFLRDYNRTVQLCRMGANPKRIKPRSFWIYDLSISTFVSVTLIVVALVLDDAGAFQLGSLIFTVGLVSSFILKLSNLFTQYDPVMIVGSFGIKAIGSYLGECVTSDGYRNFLLWDSRKYIFWKNVFVVKVNLNDKFRIETVGKDNKRTIEEISLPKDLIVEGDSAIAVKGEGLDKAGYFFYPLVRDEAGNIICMDLVAYARSKDVAMLDTLYQQTEDFSKVQRQAINMNPFVRFSQKTRGDTITGAEESGGR